MGPEILVVDNYDSFVYILVQYLGELGASPHVVRNDDPVLDDLDALTPDGVLISPGPGVPADAGRSLAVLGHFAGHRPVFGVCLGHQCIGEFFGGEVVRAPELMHGKTSVISHDGQGLFAQVSQPMEATRYHSLIVDADSIGDELVVTATSRDGLVMGLRHASLDVHGVQFHPESVLSIDGKQIVSNFVDRCGAT